jgi:hypothetical protein
MIYNKSNLKIVSKLIIDNLTADLLPKKYREENKTNTTFGHCHTASACLQQIFSSKELKLYRAIDYRGIMHWWCVDNENNIIDLTKEQYHSVSKTPPYEDGEKSNRLGFAYRERMNTLLERVCLELEIFSA